MKTKYKILLATCNLILLNFAIASGPNHDLRMTVSEGSSGAVTRTSDGSSPDTVVYGVNEDSEAKRFMFTLSISGDGLNSEGNQGVGIVEEIKSINWPNDHPSGWGITVLDNSLTVTIDDVSTLTEENNSWEIEFETGSDGSGLITTKDRSSHQRRLDDFDSPPDGIGEVFGDDNPDKITVVFDVCGEVIFKRDIESEPVEVDLAGAIAENFKDQTQGLATALDESITIDTKEIRKFIEKNQPKWLPNRVTRELTDTIKVGESKLRKKKKEMLASIPGKVEKFTLESLPDINPEATFRGDVEFQKNCCSTGNWIRPRLKDFRVNDSLWNGVLGNVGAGFSFTAGIGVQIDFDLEFDVNASFKLGMVAIEYVEDSGCKANIIGEPRWNGTLGTSISVKSFIMVKAGKIRSFGSALSSVQTTIENEI